MWTWNPKADELILAKLRTCCPGVPLVRVGTEEEYDELTISVYCSGRPDLKRQDKAAKIVREGVDRLMCEAFPLVVPDYRVSLVWGASK